MSPIKTKVFADIKYVVIKWEKFEFPVCSVAHAFVHQDTLAYVLFTAGHVDPFEAMSYNNRIPRRRGVLFLWLSGWVV